MKPLFALALLASIAGCNTVEGFGRDLAAGGEALEQAATEARPVDEQQTQSVYQPVPQQQTIYRQQPVQQINPAPIPNSTYTY